MLSAGLGGATVGVILGALGTLLAVHEVRLEVLSLASAWVLYLAIGRQYRRFGRQKQVRRRWPSGTPRWFAFALWGYVLGLGFLTAVPYASSMLILSAEFVAGPATGGIAGAILGASREAFLLVVASKRATSDWVLDLLPPRYRRLTRTADIGLILVGGLSMIVGGLVW